MHSNRFHLVTWAMSIHCCSDATIYRFQYGQISLLFHPIETFFESFVTWLPKMVFGNRFNCICYKFLFIFVESPAVVVIICQLWHPLLLFRHFCHSRYHMVDCLLLLNPFLALRLSLSSIWKQEKKNHFVNFNFGSSYRRSQFYFQLWAAINE